MILTITEVTQEFTKNGAEYRKVTGTTEEGETTKSVFDNLKFLWPLLVEGKEIELKLVKKGQFWNVINLKPADEPWPEETGMVKPGEVAKPVAHAEKATEPATKRVSGEEMGMWWKELGKRIGDGSLEKDFPKSLVKLKGQYYNKMFETLGLKKEEPKSPKELAPDEIPF